MAWKKVPNVAQYKWASKGSTWDNEIARKSGMTAESAQEFADKDQRINFFFFMNSSMFLEAGEGCEAKGQFNPGDAVFFSGEPWWGSAPQADGYTRESETNGITASLYVSGDLYSGGDSVINDLKSSTFNTVVAWALHISETGDLVFNDTTIVSGGKYVGESTWPAQLASLKDAGSSVNRLLFSVGGWECPDFEHIKTLLGNGGGKPDGILYKNFKALKDKIPGIDGVDYDDESLYDSNTYVDFALMLKTIGYNEVTFCPYMETGVWVQALKDLEAKAPGFVAGFNLQCYAGGSGNLYSVDSWIKPVAEVVGPAKAKALIDPGLWCRHGDNCSEGMCPATMETHFKGWKKLGIKGGFIWRYDPIQQCQNSGVCKGTMNTKAYAEAIINGLT